MNKIAGVMLLIIVCYTNPVQATICEQARAQQRPCIGLVLGGGGARGGAHLGVIEQLERQQVPVDLVVGTSIGAFIGGLYASGMSAEQISTLLSETPWVNGFRDRVYRDEMPMRRKAQIDDFPVNADLGISPAGLKLPKGILHGQSLAEILQKAFGMQASETDFDQLPIPFRAVATDLLTRDEIILSGGSLVQAVQASMTIPGVVRPLELNGHLLVDGGVVNNLPVSVAKQLGVDRVIAVSIDLPLLQREQLESAFSITEQLTSFLVRSGVQAQMDLLSDNDLLLQPELSNIGMLDFDHMAEAIKGGRDSAVRFVQALADFSQPQSTYRAWRQHHQLPDMAPAVIDRIVLENASSLQDELLLERLDLQPGDVYTERNIRKGLRQLYGMDIFERVSQELVTDENGQNVLTVRAEEKSWGPAYLNFRVMFEDDFHNTHQYQFAASHTYTNLSELGAEWQTELALGSNKYLYTELYWPVFSSRTFVQGSARFKRDIQVLQDENYRSAGELQNSEQQWALHTGWNISDHALITLGWDWRDGKYLVPVSFADTLQMNELSYHRYGPAVDLVWDTLDSRSFPTRGIRLATSFSYLTEDVLGSSEQSRSSSVELLAAKRWQRHTMRTRWRFDNYRTDNDALALEQFSLGGFLNLSGYPADSLFGSKIEFGSLIYLYQLNQPRMSFFNAPLYLGASVERGRVREDVFGSTGSAQATDWLWAGSVFIGWDTPLGPLYLGFGKSEGAQAKSSDALYLSFGQHY
ncbi:patatin-like phospholipase family protein [Chromatiaceae bacterium AAb-1]|nr:patatin-like phospholipase family protein [Chromatiaceae bacterium AAb-1]